MNKVSSLFFILDSFNFDIFLVSETWLTDHILDNEITPPNYRIFRRDRSSRGGGVAIFVRLSLCARLLSFPAGFECIVVELPVSHLVFSCIYLPPSPDSDVLQSMFTYLNHLSPAHTHFIAGDFNMPDINWESLTSASSSSAHDSFCEVVYNNNLHQLIDKHTHIKGNILDLVLSNRPDSIDNINVHNHSYSSDHYLISASLPSIYTTTNLCSHPDPSSLTTKFIYRKADWEGLSDFLLDADFDQCYSTSDIDTL